MRNVYLIEQFNIVHNEIHFILNETTAQRQLQSTGQVLADSDNLSFLYVIDEQEAYSYLSFPKQLWPALLTMITSNQKAFLVGQHTRIELVDFAQELQALVYNIEGNSNYGEPFVQAVETAFADFLTL